MKTIVLSNGSVCFVDDCDYEMVSNYSWQCLSLDHLKYAFTQVKTIDGKKRTIFLHRLILAAKKGQVVDHRDGNGLNNQRSNLRFCTMSQNRMNSRSFRIGTSKYKGVCRHNGVKKKWQAYINISKKKVKLGYYETEEQAAIAYDNAAKKNYGDFAKVNF